MTNLARPGIRTGNSKMIGLLTNITEDLMRVITRNMTELFTIVTDNTMTRIDIVTSLVAVMTGTGLAIIAEMNQNLTKSDVVGDVFLDSYLEMSHAILHMGPAIFSKVAAAVMENIAVLREALDNGIIGHFVWSIKNLYICQRTVDILKGKRLTRNSHNMGRKQFLRSSISEGQHNLTRRLALNKGNTVVVNIRISQGGEDFIRWNSSARIKIHSQRSGRQFILDIGDKLNRIRIRATNYLGVTRTRINIRLNRIYIISTR